MILKNIKGDLHIAHEPYYRDRLTERDLCHDFPADEIYIDGLHAMQSHFCTHNVPVAIPVVRVMNAAHFMLAYAFSTQCSGDQMEYDAIAYGSVGHDKKVMLVTLIVLAAMLKRTEGFRAGMCRNILLENRTDDFHDGVTLYDQFLRSAEKHFAEEDFLLDTHQQIMQLQAENTRLTSENIQLKYTITTMEEKYQQINIGTQNNNYGTINNYYGFSQPSSSNAEDVTPSEDPSSVSPESNSGSYFPYLTQKCFEEKRVASVEAEIQAARKGTAEDMWHTLWNNENLGYLEVEFINATTLFRAIEKWYGKLPYKVRNFRDARNKR